MKPWIKFVPVVGQVLQLGIWIADTVKERRKRKFSAAEAEEKAIEAMRRADRVLDEARKAKRK